MTFLKWANMRYGGESNLFGEVARSMLSDPKYPKRARSYKTIRKHIKDTRLLDAFDIAYPKYKSANGKR